MTRALAGLLVVLVAAPNGAWVWRQMTLIEGGVPALEVAVDPVAIDIDPERLQIALARAPWVSPGVEGPGLWVIGYRECLSCIGFLRSESPELTEAGVDVHVILFAPDEALPPERAVIAEIGARRTWATLRAYIEGSAADYHAPGRFPVASDPVRSAVIAAGRRTRDEIEAVMEANGYEVVYPLMFWRDDAGTWRAAVGDTSRGRRAIRQALAGEAGE